jgi:predicted O-methyltransferase YrrM
VEASVTEQEIGRSGFEFDDLAWLFNCDNRNCAIILQTFSEAALLWKMVRATAGPILEIGRKFAGSTSLLAAASGDRSIFSIDTKSVEHAKALEFLERVEIKARVHRLIGDSHNPLPNHSFGFVFIDGDHSFEGVLADVVAHWNELHSMDGRPALAAFHDALPNDNLKWKVRPRRWRRFRQRLKNFFRREKQPDPLLAYKPGVLRVCRALVDCRVAEPWRSAGSMWVLRKLTDLPKDFGQRARTAVS